jgi:Flp pilus assembly protein TadD
MNPMAFATRIALLLISFALAPYAIAQTDDYQEASTLYHAGQYTQAMERLSSYLKSKPTDARARFLQGLILTEQGKTADAINVFTALTADYPELPEPYNNLAVLYAKQGQYDQARAELELAIRTHPSYAMAYENLGDIYTRMAAQAYDHALQLDKRNTAVEAKLQQIKGVSGK